MTFSYCECCGAKKEALYWHAASKSSLCLACKNDPWPSFLERRKSELSMVRKMVLVPRETREEQQ